MASFTGATSIQRSTRGESSAEQYIYVADGALTGTVWDDSTWGTLLPQIPGMPQRRPRDLIANLRTHLSTDSGFYELTEAQLIHFAGAEFAGKKPLKPSRSSPKHTNALDMIRKAKAWEERIRVHDETRPTIPIDEAAGDQVSLVTNLGADPGAEVWLAMCHAHFAEDDWKRERNALRDSVPRLEDRGFVHFGVMRARLVGPALPAEITFYSVAANYFERQVHASPWTLIGWNPREQEGGDVHTEMFCFYELHLLLSALGALPATVTIAWSLEKPMCKDRCKPTESDFIAYWKRRGVVVTSNAPGLDNDK